MNPRSPRPLGRQRTAAASRRSILVFCEGQETEDGYLVDWRRQFRDRVLVTVDPFHGAPLQLVDRAVEAKRAEEREERRGRGSAHDEVWCMFDRDQHPNISQALDKAQANDIRVVLSNPCIELWFVLHFEDRTAHIERGDAQRRSRELLGCDKVLSAGALADLGERYLAAKDRAQALDAKHAGDGSPLFANPSSNAWQLVDRIRLA